MFLKKGKAIAVLNLIIPLATDYMCDLKVSGYCTTNFFLYAECSLIALAKLFANIYNGNNRFGDAIVKESLSGSWRSFISAGDKKSYENRINLFFADYQGIIQNEFGENPDNILALNSAYGLIAECMAKHVFAKYNQDSEEIIMGYILGIKEYVNLYCK